MIDENGQHWIVLVPGMDLPEEQPKGFQFWDGCEWDSWPPSFRPMNESNTYRYPVTEAEYKAHHWCLAHGIAMPDSYELIRFGKARSREEFIYTDQGNIVGWTHHHWQDAVAPILRKKACEHKEVKFEWKVEHEQYMTAVICQDCGMIRKLGDWEESK